MKKEDLAKLRQKIFEGTRPSNEEVYQLFRYIELLETELNVYKKEKNDE